MADNEENSTTTPVYDYSDYYNIGISDAAPCDIEDAWAFGKVFLPTLYSLVFILAFIGNSLVVCVLVKHRHQTNLTDICLFNLALSDLLFVLVLPLYSHYSVVNEWMFGTFMCSFISGLYTTGFFCGSFFIVIMTVDRYLVIIYALGTLKYRTLKAGVALSVAVWMLSLFVSMPVFVFTRVDRSQQAKCYFQSENKVWKHYNVITINMLGLLIPFLVMVVCYSRIITRLMNTRNTRKHRVIKLIISIMIIYFIFWAPYNITLFLTSLKTYLPGDKCKVEKRLRIAEAVTETFAYTHCCLNPIIYAFVGQKFMKRVSQLLRKCVPWIPLTSTADLWDSSSRRSSVMSRSSEVTSTFIK